MKEGHVYDERPVKESSIYEERCVKEKCFYEERSVYEETETRLCRDCFYERTASMIELLL